VWLSNPILRQIVAVWQRDVIESYLVGGAVLDGLLNRLDRSVDLDLVVSRDALRVAFISFMIDQLGVHHTEK